MKQSFYSNGKLLITGEYLVLDGAEALAVPTKFGQTLDILPQEKKFLHWKSFDIHYEMWFETDIYWKEIFDNETMINFSETKKTLLKILHHAWKQNPNANIINQGFEVETHLSFPRNWGLGTSSTLINNIAKWFQVDPFQLLNESFGGSGYDIACADAKNPIVYQRINQEPFFKNVDFNPVFKQHIYFVYLNQKQNSNAQIASYESKRQESRHKIPEINVLTNKIIDCKDELEFQMLIQSHEAILSQILGMRTLQESFFSDFEGVVKSLGAWGGDFVLVHSKWNPKEYFQNKGFHTILSFEEMCLGF